MQWTVINEVLQESKASMSKIVSICYMRKFTEMVSHVFHSVDIMFSK